MDKKLVLLLVIVTNVLSITFVSMYYRSQRISSQENTPKTTTKKLDEINQVPLIAPKGVISPAKQASSSYPHIKDIYGWTPINWATQRGHIKIVRLLEKAVTNREKSH